jgi:NADPH-dependent 2,4-dienoyl-CoA reductase/sulfur reductase-like enzyme
MTNYKYLIVGGGMTAAAAIEGIREIDKGGSVGVIGADPQRPYNRPPLSKGLWKGEERDSIWRAFDNQNVTLHTGLTVRELDPQKRHVTDEQGTSYGYDKLLLATGAEPKQLGFGGDNIIYFRTLGDYDRLRAMAQPGKRFAVIGSGFIGSEIAAALAMNGCEVVLVFPDKAIGSRMYPLDLAEFLNDYYREKGVQLLTERTATGMERRGDRFALKIEGADGSAGQEEVVDGVVAGIGVQPDVELAQAAGITVEDGIRVNSALKTNLPDIYAAGDVARFHNPALDKWLRVEHEDNANSMGNSAGKSMAGAAIMYDHLPFFYSDLFDLGYEAVGELDSRLEIVTDWKEPYKEGVVYYLRDGRVRGVLLWNVWEQVDAARKLIASTQPVQPADLKGRLPE